MPALCPTCGNNRFECCQRVSVRAIVDENENWVKDIENSFFDCDDFTGPFQCTKCMEECDNLSDWQEQKMEKDNNNVSKMSGV
jgi:hypothetical protein